MEKATLSIEAYKAENQKLAAESERLTKESAELEARIDQSQQLIRKIDPILASVISKSKELYTVNGKIHRQCKRISQQSQTGHWTVKKPF